MRVKTVRRFIDRADAMKQREPGDEFECGQERADQLESLGFVESIAEPAEGLQEDPVEGTTPEPAEEPQEDPGEAPEAEPAEEPAEKPPVKESAPAKPKAKEQKAAARPASKNRTSRK